MKKRFKQVKKVINGTINFCYIKEQKKHWWSKWKVVMKDAAPLLFYKLPEGVQAVNELPNFKLSDEFKTPMVSNISIPQPIFPKGVGEVRMSMVDMVRNADEIYVGIKQDGKYYIAYDGDSIESISDLQNLKLFNMKERET